MKKLLILFLLLFVSCAKVPEKTDTEQLVGSVENKMCGNGTVEANEECDFIGTQSCNEDDPALIGPLKCDYYCKKDKSECNDKKTCSEKFCYGNGTCAENDSFDITCKCYANYKGGNCVLCEEDFHYDLNGKCISDSICTYVGCEYENEECKIYLGQAVCRCNPPRQGKECDECMDSYYLEDNECKTKYCSIANLECPDYEKCHDSDGIPKCGCISETQNPEDCSKCLPGYDMDLEEDKVCINRKYANCIHNPDAVENSYDIVVEKELYYTDENGWNTPGYCAWKCPDNTFLENDTCNAIYISSSNALGIEIRYPIGTNSKGDLLAGDRLGQVYKLSDSLEFLHSTGLTYSNILSPRVGPDDNIYFIDNGNFAVFDTKSKESYEFSSRVDSSSLITILNNGVISAGEQILDGFKERSIAFDTNFESVSISDLNGNILVVESPGYIYFLDDQYNIIWKKTIENTSKLSLNPVMDKNGTAYIPYYETTNYKYQILALDLATGEPLTNQIQASYPKMPSIAIDDSGNKYVAVDGSLIKYDKDNSQVFSLFNYSGASSSPTPVITDNGKIYYAKKNIIVCTDTEGKVIWEYDIVYSNIQYLFHNNSDRLYAIADNNLFIFDAPGKLKGDWPQYMQNSNFTGSLKEMSFAGEPPRTQIISPEKNEIVKGDVSFEWENDDPNAEFLLSDVDEYDRFHTIFGPTTANSALISDINNQENYNWVLVTNNGNGIYSVEKSVFSKRSSF